MITINETFKKGILSNNIHQIKFKGSNNIEENTTTDRPKINYINSDNDLEIDWEDFTYNDNTHEHTPAKFRLKYTGDKKSFTSNIKFKINGITGIDDSNEFNIECNGKLELKPLRFHNISEETKTINLSATASGLFGNNLDIDYQISFDEPNSWKNLRKVTIEPLYLTVQSFTIPAGESLWVRSNEMSSWYIENNHFYFNSDNIGGIELGGDIMSLIKSEDMPTYCFYHLFDNLSALTSFADDFSLSSKLNENCYNGMFYNCTSLETIPANLLPAETLVSGCYNAMFSCCTGLKTIPADLLPAKTLANYCYQDMFNGCTGLENIPADLLPATTLTNANSCYKQMFMGCTKLETIPENLLQARELSSNCYESMFNGCTGLTNIRKNLLPASTLSYECYKEMFKGCTSLTSVASDLLPSTRLAGYCYRGMFMGCTGITTAPTLPAPTLVNYCYVEMLRNCSNLNNITMLATNIATKCFDDWVSGVSSSGTFIKYVNTTIPSGNNGIPSGWTVQSYVPTNN